MIVMYHMVLLPDMMVPDSLDIIRLHFGQGVPLFYALSGFVLSYGYLGKLKDRSQVVRFYIRRYFRIAPLFYFMILIWLVAYKVKWGDLMPFSLFDVVLNFSLLFGLVPGKHESIVWAGWSIGVEIIFYILFPVITILVTGLRSCAIALFVMFILSSLFYTSVQSMDSGTFGYMNIVTHFPTFLCGVMAFLLWEKAGFIQNAKWGGVLFVFSVMSIICVLYLPSALRLSGSFSFIRLDIYIWSIIFMMLILSMCLWPGRFLVNQVSKGLGKISFSLYLWHPPVIMLLTGVYVELSLLFGYGILGFLSCAILTVSVVSLVAYYSFSLIETPGMRYGKNLADQYGHK